jgi:hypothetical protein
MSMLAFLCVPAGLLCLYRAVTQTEERPTFLLLGLGALTLGLACWYAVIAYFQDKESPPMEIKPWTGDKCPFCSGQMIPEPHLHCDDCGVRCY